MKKSVYIETSVISYLAARPSRDLIRAAHQQVTREWWETRSRDYELFISQAVTDESSRGDPDAANRRLTILSGLQALETSEGVIRLAESLLRVHALPAKAGDDALHIAFSSVHALDLLVTWNCAHIANAVTMPAILRTIRAAGYEPPVICTPHELLGIYYEP